jgi:predicted aconitase with swiveling domain
LYQLAKAKPPIAPTAIVNAECEAIVAVGAIISEIPCVDKIDLSKIKTGDKLEVDGNSGTVTIL